MEHLYSNGKLLLTGEYVVLDGAMALALPTKKGQSLEVIHNNSSTLVWTSVLEDGSIWFTVTLALPTLKVIEGSDNEITQKLVEILKEVQSLNSSFLLSGT